MIAIATNFQTERTVAGTPAVAAVPAVGQTAKTTVSSADSVSLSEIAEARLLHQQGQNPLDIAIRLNVAVSRVQDDLKIRVDGTAQLAAGASSAIPTPSATVEAQSAPGGQTKTAGAVLGANSPSSASTQANYGGTGADPGTKTGEQKTPGLAPSANGKSNLVRPAPSQQDTELNAAGKSQSQLAPISTVAALTSAGGAPPRIEGLVVPVIVSRG